MSKKSTGSEKKLGQKCRNLRENTISVVTGYVTLVIMETIIHAEVSVADLEK